MMATSKTKRMDEVVAWRDIHASHASCFLGARKQHDVIIMSTVTICSRGDLIDSFDPTVS
jgi:hypothetical protein